MNKEVIKKGLWLKFYLTIILMDVWAVGTCGVHIHEIVPDWNPTFSAYLRQFEHANIWHLAGNLLCLWCLPITVGQFLFASMATALLLLPFDVSTIGISGVLFFLIGRIYGRLGARSAAAKCLALVVLYGLLPGVAMLYHVVTLISGYIDGWFEERYC